MENNIERQLMYINDGLNAINRTLNKLVEISEEDKITFKVEGDKLVGLIPTKQEFRQAVARFEKVKKKNKND